MQAVPTSVSDAAAITEDREEAFHLFVERETGRRAVAYRGGPTGCRVALDDGSAPAVTRRAHVTTSHRTVETMGPEQAVEHLRLAGLPFLFFHAPEVGHARGATRQARAGGARRRRHRGAGAVRRADSVAGFLVVAVVALWAMSAVPETSWPLAGVRITGLLVTVLGVTAAAVGGS